MLAEDATFAMPPAASWFGPRTEIAEFLRGFAMSGMWRWKGIRAQANGQVAIGFYAWDDDAQAYLAFALNVLSFRGREIADVTAFINRSIAPEERESYHRWVDQPVDAARLAGTFGRFGLPDRIPQAQG
jgi:RNA polymerase sigma-70 factor (ECF subfamily)